MLETLKRGVVTAACAARHWSSDNASTTGAALAFFSAFSLAPLLVIILTVTGWIVGGEAAYGQIGSQLNSLFGASTAKILQDAMKNSQQAHGLVANITSVITLLIGATTILAALQQALDQIWQSAALERSGWMGWIRTRFLSLGFILALGFLLLASLSITTGLSGIRGQMTASHPGMVGLIGAVDLVVSLVLVAVLFAVIYRYMPARRLPWTVVLIGGALTAILFDVGRWAVGLYLAHSSQASAFGAASSFVALLLWLYYTAQIFLFGAEFTACLGGLRKEKNTTASAGTGKSVKAAAQLSRENLPPR